MQHRANLIPSPTAPAPEVAEDVPAHPTSPLANDTVAHATPPPARQQLEEFFVPDPIDHLLHLADDGSAQGGNIGAAGVADVPINPVASNADRGSNNAATSHGDSVEHPDEHTDQAPGHDADDSNNSRDMARLGG